MADERGSRNSNNSRGRSYGNSRGNSGSRGRGNGGGFHRGARLNHVDGFRGEAHIPAAGRAGGEVDVGQVAVAGVGQAQLHGAFLIGVGVHTQPSAGSRKGHRIRTGDGDRQVDGHGFIDRGGGAGNLIGARLDVFGRRHGDVHRLRGARLHVQCGHLGGLARRQEAHLPARGGVGRKGVGLAGKRVVDQSGAEGEGRVRVALLRRIFRREAALADFFGAYGQGKVHRVRDVLALCLQSDGVIPVGGIQRHIHREGHGVIGLLIFHMDHAHLVAARTEGALPALRDFLHR